MQRLSDNDVLVGDIKETPREGSLLPETYEFERGETRTALLAKMARDQTKVVDEIWAKRAPDLPIKSPGELVTLASIVEKETGKADERPHVAGVFINRLRKHMKLESDPTIVYGLVFGKGTLGHSISKTELLESTPYNTYIIAGLPPGPICNPGKAAMEAAANPATTKDIFFVADGTGGHAFAETLDQHLKNVAHGARSRRTPRIGSRPTPRRRPARRRRRPRPRPSTARSTMSIRTHLRRCSPPCADGWRDRRRPERAGGAARQARRQPSSSPPRWSRARARCRPPRRQARASKISALSSPASTTRRRSQSFPTIRASAGATPAGSRARRRLLGGGARRPQVADGACAICNGAAIAR